MAPEPSAEAPKRKMGKKSKAAAAAASAAIAAALAPGEPDRVARPPPPSCEVLRELLRAKGLRTGGKNADLVKRLADAIAKDEVDDTSGSADSNADVAAVADQRVAQPRRQRRRCRSALPKDDFDGDEF